MSSAKENKELFRFINKPKYREKVIANVHKEQDNQYNRRIKQIESERNRLFKSRVQEIARIANGRWEKSASDKLLINRTEGKIRFNQSEVLFSSIKGATINLQTGFRIVTIEQSKSKKHASIGGGIVGGALFGPVGALAGGVGLGKTKTKGTSTSNQIPTCMHIGVMINIDGFVSELVLLSSQVDQSSAAFSNTYSQAQSLISQLGILANTPVPTTFIKPEEENSVLCINKAIAQKQYELNEAIDDRPTYALPGIYRTVEQQEMTDAEYIEYLKNLDDLKKAQQEHEIEMARQRKAELKEQIKNERKQKKELARQKKQELKELSEKQ